MRRLLQLAARLYPPAWRARYGPEFDALLEDAGASWRMLGDVLKGAIVMQITRWNIVRTMAVCGAAGLVIAAAMAYRIQDSYVSTAVVQFAPGAVAGSDTVAGLASLERHVLSRSTLSALIQQFGLYPEERKTLPLEDIVQAMLNRHIQITLATRPAGKSWPHVDAMAIRFSDTDPARAQAVTRELSGRFIAGGTPAVSLTMLDPASLPSHPFEPNRLAWMIAGLLIGLAAGVMWMGIRRWPVVVLPGIAGMLLGGLIATTLPNTWVASAVATVAPPEAVAQVLTYARAAGKGIDVQATGRPGSLYIQSSTHDRHQSRAAVQEFTTGLIHNSGVKVTSVEVSDTTSVPLHPGAPQRLGVALLGLLAGLLVGAFWQRFRARPVLS